VTKVLVAKLAQNQRMHEIDRDWRGIYVCNDITSIRRGKVQAVRQEIELLFNL